MQECRRFGRHRFKTTYEHPTERGEICELCGAVRRTDMPSGRVTYLFPKAGGGTDALDPA